LSAADSAFTGSIPELYERHLGPLLFAPYAHELAARIRAQPAARILETAAGTGIVTRALHAALPAATIEATDLNPAMIAHAAAQLAAPNVTWSVANAMKLPFEEGSFDVVICQFGVMFIPDRVLAFREARRVLEAGGRFVFTMWASLEHNPFAETIDRAAASMFPEDPPSFLARVPYGHGDRAATEAELRAAGFSQIAVEALELPSRAPSAADAAIGFCQGTPLRMEIEVRDAARLSEITEAAARAVADRFGAGPVEAPMRADVFVATK
jgi:ubiquinone/menaquinone biosynthesis C-methylase UbiE